MPTKIFQSKNKFTALAHFGDGFTLTSIDRDTSALLAIMCKVFIINNKGAEPLF